MPTFLAKIVVLLVLLRFSDNNQLIYFHQNEMVEFYSEDNYSWMCFSEITWLCK